MSALALLAVGVGLVVAVLRSLRRDGSPEFGLAPGSGGTETLSGAAADEVAHLFPYSDRPLGRVVPRGRRRGWH